MNSLLQEVDAKTGKSIMTFGTNGVVDLREGIDGRDPATIGNIQSNKPGEVFQNIIILGSATGEGYMSPPGDIRAYDVLHRQAGVDVPYRAPAGRVRLRHVAEGRVQIHWWHQRLGRVHGRYARAASPTSRSVRLLTISTARIGSAAISSARRSWRSMFARASGYGIFKSFITISGISTRAQHRN